MGNKAARRYQVCLFFFAFSAWFVRLSPIPADVAAHLELVIQSSAVLDNPVASFVMSPSVAPAWLSAL